MAAPKKYRAFISYSHQTDQRTVRSIHNGILRIHRAWYQRAQLAIYRDETALSATAGLASALRQNICDSEYFILIASPEAANSKWVAVELACWCEQNAREVDKLLIVLATGEICWDAEAGDFDWSRTNALPRSLAGLFREEPKYVDLRASHDAGRLSLRDRHFLVAIAELAGPLYGVSKEALLAEETRRLRRTVASLGASSLLFLAVAILAATFAYKAARSQRAETQAKKLAQNNEQEAIRQRKLAVSNEQLARKNEGIARENEKLAKQQEAAALQRLYVSQMSLAYREWAENNPALVYDLLASHLPKRAGGDLRSFDWYYLWHAANDDLALIMEPTPVTAIAAAQDGNTIATAAASGKVRLYDRLGQLKRELPGLPEHRPFDRLAFAGPNVLVGWASHAAIRSWDLARSSVVRDYRPVNYSRTAHALSADGSTIAYQTESDEILVRAAAANDDNAGRSLRPKVANVDALALSRDGRLLAVGTGTGEVFVNGAETPDALITLGRQAGLVSSVALSPDASLLASGGGRGEVKIRDLKTRKERRTLTYPQMPDTIVSLAFSADSRLLAAGTGDDYNTAKPGTIIVWDLATGTSRSYRGHSAAAGTLAFAPNNEFLVSGSADKTVRLWDFTADQSRLSLQKPESRRVFHVAVSPDGTRVVTGSEGAGTGSPGDVDLWNTTPGKRTLLLRGHASDVDAVAFCPDGSILSGSRDGTIRLWNGDSDQARAVLKTEPNFPVYAVAVDAARHRLAAGGGIYPNGGAIEVWDLLTLQPKRVIRAFSEPIRSLAFSPDGKWLAVGAGSENPTTQTTMDLFELPSLRAAQAFRGFASAVRSLAFSPSGDALAVGWGDRNKPGNITVWDLNPLQLRGVLRGHQQMVMSLAFTPDGRALISSSGAGLTQYAGEIKIWDLTSMQERATLAQLTKPIWEIALSANGRTLAAVTGDQSVLIWQAATDEAVLRWSQTLMRADPTNAERALEFARACSAAHQGACLSEARKALLSLKTAGTQVGEVNEWLAIPGAVSDTGRERRR